MPKERLLQELAAAYERVIAFATEVEQRGGISTTDDWGPRQIVGHLAGWEVMATVRTPKIAAGMAPLEESDEERQAVMNDAINTTIVAMIGNQSLDVPNALLRKYYQSDIAVLKTLDERFFQPGEYVYERTKGAIEHCKEHIEQMQKLVSLLAKN